MSLCLRDVQGNLVSLFAKNNKPILQWSMAAHRILRGKDRLCNARRNSWKERKSRKTAYLHSSTATSFSVNGIDLFDLSSILKVLTENTIQGDDYTENERKKREMSDTITPLNHHRLFRIMS